MAWVLLPFEHIRTLLIFEAQYSTFIHFCQIALERQCEAGLSEAASRQPWLSPGLRVLGYPPQPRYR
jgi:hypothetical protein